MTAKKKSPAKQLSERAKKLNVEIKEGEPTQQPANETPVATSSPEAATKKAKAKKDTAKAKDTNGHATPGVIGSIVEFLKAATPEQPITKAAILDKLVERFPARGLIALGRTLNCQLPTRLRKEKELDVQRNDNGYFIKK